MSLTARTTRTAAVALAALGLVPAAASAATVQRVNDRVVINAAAGEANDLLLDEGNVLPGGGEAGFFYQVEVHELGSAPLTAGAGCSQVSARLVSCSTQNVQTWRVTANLSDGDDKLVSDLGDYGAADVDAFLGAGNDSYTATAATNPGSTDYVEGATGNDTIRTGHLADEIHGDDGNDLIFGGDANDHVEGGLGDDRIDGDLGNDALHGQAGNDTIGQLVINWTCSSTFRCMPSGYVFATDPSADGRDTVTGGEGNDRLSLHDRALDNTPSCGAGTDTLERDPADPAPTAGCETITNRS